jgi:CubicO group peptidase (beta-lactamase class C family)
LLAETSAATSQTLCTSVFVSGLQPDDAFRKQLRPEPGMGLVNWAMHYEVDKKRREVHTRILGTFSSRSVFAPGRGRTLVFEGRLPSAVETLSPEPALLREIAGSGVVIPEYPRLRAAIDAAFEEPRRGPSRNTAAIDIVHNGRVIGEKYAPGYGPDVALWGHSLAKSVVNALVGILVRNGAPDTNRPAPVPEWHTPNGPRAAITLDNLLRMDAGFGFDEGVGSTLATRMFYTQPDTTRFAVAAKLTTSPGTRWGYSSRSYAVLSRIVGEAVGGGPNFIHHNLFDPLGMQSATVEYDSAGTMMGAYSILASPRDWARFGPLYLNDGVVAGHRILPEGWVHYSTSPTLDSSYGTGFWLNNTDREIPVWRFPWGLPGAPSDTFMARGYLGQYIVIVPSESLVVVRFGYSRGRGAAMESVGRLIHDIIIALHLGVSEMHTSSASLS